MLYLNFKERLVLKWLSIPYFPFQKRIIKILFSDIASKVRGCVFSYNCRDYIGLNLLSRGVYEPLSIAMAINLISENDIFIDVGANIGLYSIILANEKKCRVLSFEPNIDTFIILRRNISLNGLNEKITALPCAIIDRMGFSAIRMECSGNIGGSSAIRGGALVNYAPSMNFDDAMRALDVQKIKLLKIDIEGAENLFFMGANLLKVENIILEWIDDKKTSSVEKFLCSELYTKYLYEFDVFDINLNHYSKISEFEEFNVFLKRKLDRTPVNEGALY